MRRGVAVSVMGHTGQSEAIHSPEAWASTVVRLTMPVARSMAVVWTVAISCWPSALRTISRPSASGAYRKARLPSPVRCGPMMAMSDFSGLAAPGLSLCQSRGEGADQFHRTGAWPPSTWTRSKLYRTGFRGSKVGKDGADMPKINPTAGNILPGVVRIAVT